MAMKTAAALAAMTLLLLLPGVGCTIGAEGKATLATTTSAEQTQRIFWQDVKDHKWQVVQGLLVENVTWRNGKETLTRDQIVPYLQQMKLSDFVITNLVVKANQADMTVMYDLQWTTASSTQPVNLHAVAVWQQVPLPADNALRKEKKRADKSAPYLLTVEDLVPDVANP